MPHISAVYTLYLAMFILAFNGLYAKLIPADPTTITQLRSVVAVLGFVVFLTWQKKTLRLSGWREYVGVYALGVLLGLHWGALFQAFQVSTVAIGILAYFTYPVITVFVEPMFTGGRVKLHDVIAGLVVVVGVVTMVSQDLLNLGSTASVINSSSYLTGAFWGIFAAFAMTFRNIVQRQYFPQVSSIRLMLHQVIAVSFVALPFVDFHAVESFSFIAWGIIILLGLISTAGGHTLIVVSLKSLPAKTVAMISCAQPVLTVSLAWVFLGEVPEVWVMLGGAIILSVALYESISHSRRYAKQVQVSK